MWARDDAVVCGAEVKEEGASEVPVDVFFGGKVEVGGVKLPE